SLDLQPKYQCQRLLTVFAPCILESAQPLDLGSLRATSLWCPLLDQGSLHATAGSTFWRTQHFLSTSGVYFHGVVQHCLLATYGRYQRTFAGSRSTVLMLTLEPSPSSRHTICGSFRCDVLDSLHAIYGYFHSPEPY